MTLKKDIRTLKGKEEPKWVCKICGLKIKDKHQLMRHSFVKCEKYKGKYK